ncbi:pyridoxamine 5'-phosphate oxidase family protein [Rhodococcus sp. NPDC057014]|uniref:pyridoxamine 5'-phosphate oxidase family protein n=1 Tax=Rhodococcus sp. NPDC057014 TaxID=3346000 RepID=UPI00362F259E
MHSRPESADGPLTTGECLSLLRSIPCGRLVYTEGALPAVRPVTFAAPDGEIVIPTGDDPWFDRFEDTILALEAGSIAPSTRTGWTVLAIGRSRFHFGTDDLAGFDDPARAPWSAVPGVRYLVIDIGSLTGRRTTLLRPAGDLR